MGAALIVWVFDLESQGLVDRRLRPELRSRRSALPGIGFSDVTALIGSAAAITFVGYSDVALTGRAFAARTGETIDANREFLALGAANVASGLTGGFALSASGSRTAIIDAMRARTPGHGARRRRCAWSSSWC